MTLALGHPHLRSW